MPTHISCREILFDSQVAWTSKTYASPKLLSVHYIKPEVRNQAPSHSILGRKKLKFPKPAICMLKHSTGHNKYPRSTPPQ